ncbi:hypothetical protein CTheo_4997 [Ceratobasidium theobromae]|uniref:SUZ domain-containing protein n=1 Tax=Ceratobasidium theobromae TaxID=1582974 RepID=A0A5N5QJA2_9AGAM|nr:hypothetical protein CTheo_4997 [Ceratobasidium theobromae]
MLKNDSRSVPDDWDNDDTTEESPKAIWERANTAAPMPQILGSQSNLPPVTAIMATRQILRRPKPLSQSGTDSANRTPSNSKSLEEREADYKAARERIFANSEGGSASSSREASPAPKRGILIRGRGGNNGANGHRKSNSGTPEGSSGAGVAREPHGAQDGRGFAPRGKRGRGGGRAKSMNVDPGM